jgi:hypothetical protein
MREAARWIRDGSRVLDVGCHQGEFLRLLGTRIGPSFGMDPVLASDVTGDNYTLQARPFDGAASWPDHSFDAVFLLATIEHIQEKEAIP